MRRSSSTSRERRRRSRPLLHKVPDLQGNFFINVNTMNNQPLHLTHQPHFMVNGRFMMPGQGGRFANVNVPLPKTATGKDRTGSSSVWVIDNSTRVTQTLELVPSKAASGLGDKRLRNTVRVGYVIENKGTQPQTIGIRLFMDTYVIDNDGCLFAAPTIPGKVLDGMVLQGKTLPPYLQMLQRPDLKAPGFVSHLTLNMGSRLETPEKLVLTSLRVGTNNWQMPAVPAMGDSAIGLYWPIKEIKPGGKREMAYAYGEGVAVPADAEGRFQISLGGSFEPGKAFTVTATVSDPAVGQSLALDLPPGMERLEGKEIQPVPSLADGQDTSAVLWKARVVKPGQYPLRIRSSAGVTQTKVVTVSAIEQGEVKAGSQDPRGAETTQPASHPPSRFPYNRKLAGGRSERCRSPADRAGLENRCGRKPHQRVRIPLLSRLLVFHIVEK